MKCELLDRDIAQDMIADLDDDTPDSVSYDPSRVAQQFRYALAEIDRRDARIAELEPCREVIERVLAGERFVGDTLREMLAQSESPADRFRRFVKLRDDLTEADVCLACGDHTPGRSCQCENDE